MTRKYKKYGPEHFEEIKPQVTEWMIGRIPIRVIAKKLKMKQVTLSNMLYRNGLFANTVRHQYKKANPVEDHSRVNLELFERVTDLNLIIEKLTDGVAHFNKNRGDMNPLLEAYFEALEEKKDAHP